MAVVGYHASHEQHAPSMLLRYVCAAQDAGFQAAMCSDHWAPWSARQGHSGHAWAWLGSALQATRLPFGVVTAPGQRYHPAVTAQAIATMAEMHPGRFWAALGSGEAVNEHITGERWPDKQARDERWTECAQIIRRLLDGELVTHRGHVCVDRARLWSRPDLAPPLVAAAVSAGSARRAGAWADGLITIAQPRDALRATIDAFREGGGVGRPVFVQAHLAWAPSEAEALAAAHDQWRSNVFSSEIAWNLEMPEQFDAAAEYVRPEDVRRSVMVSDDVDRHAAWLAKIIDVGADAVYLHEVGLEQERFIDVFGDKVLPQLTTVVA